MVCEKCGTEVTKNDKFCPKCGAEVKAQKKTGMIKPIIMIGLVIAVVIICVIMKYNAIIPLSILAIVCVTVIINRKILKLRKKKTDTVEEHNFTDAETKKFSEYFVSREEKYISSLGNSYIMNFFINGNLRRGFAIISDKRVYFRGSCFSGQGKDLKKTDEERTVDIKDVTGSGFIYRRYLGVLLGLFTALVVLLGGIGGSMFTALRGWAETQHYQQREEEAATDYQTVQGSSDKIAELDAQIKVLEDQKAPLETELAHQETKLMTELYEPIISPVLDNIDYTLMYGTEFGDAYWEYCCVVAKQCLDNEPRDFDKDISPMFKFYDALLEIGLPTPSLSTLPILYYQEEAKMRGDIDWDAIDWDAIDNAYYLFLKSVVPDLGDVDKEDEDFEDKKHKLIQEFKEHIWLTGWDLEEVSLKELKYMWYDTAKVMANYMLTSPDAEWAKVLKSHISGAEFNIEYDADMLELKTEINNIIHELSNLLEEKEKVSEMLKNIDEYEEDYNDSKQETFEHYMLTTIATAGAGLLVTFFISCIAVFVDYLSKRKTLFEIQYAGGRIAFDVSYYAKTEIDDFQKQLRRAKDFAQDTATVRTVTVEAHTQTPTQSSVPDDLRKYANLLKEGLISQEEYDAMKKKILGL